MALYKTSEILKDAQAKKYGVGFFDVVDLHMIRAYITAAEEVNSPVIFGPAESLLTYSTFEWIAPLMLQAARMAKVPVALHMDHTYRYDVMLQAMRHGLCSVMFDGSSLPYEENVAKSAEFARIAHAMDVELESELGHVSGLEGETGTEEENVYTDPEAAQDFIERTKTDFLAVSIGTIHGVYKKTPKLNLPLLHDLRGRLSQPLVLHGGSGLSDDDFRNVISGGISKINIYTDVILAANKAIADNVSLRYEDVVQKAEQAMAEAAKVKMLLFGSAGRA